MTAEIAVSETRGQRLGGGSRRDADALDSLGRRARDELRRVAREHDRALLPVKELFQKLLDHQVPVYV